MTRKTAAFRMYVSLSAACTVQIAALDPTSQHHLIMSGGGPLFFAIALGAMGFLALMGVLDVVINDVMPERYSIRWTHRYRHTVFMALALAQVALVFALVHGDDFKSAMSRYILDASFCVYVAVRGVRDHGREVRELRQREVTASQRAAL